MDERVGCVGGVVYKKIRERRGEKGGDWCEDGSSRRVVVMRKKKGKGKRKKKKKKKKIFPFTGFVIVVVENKYEVVGWELKSLKFGVYYYTQGVFVHVRDNKSGGSDRKKTNKTHTHHMITKWTMAGTPWIYNQFYHPQTQTKLTMLWVLYYYYYYHYTYKSLDYTSQCSRWYHWPLAYTDTSS